MATDTRTKGFLEHVNRVAVPRSRTGGALLSMSIHMSIHCAQLKTLGLSEFNVDAAIRVAQSVSRISSGVTLQA